MAKAITLNAIPKWADVKDDYVIRYEGHLMGRIRLAGERSSQGNTWEWSIDVPCMGTAFKGYKSGTPRARIGA